MGYLRSKTVVRIMDLISEGEIEGLYDGAKSILFDAIPLQNADDTYNFEGVTWAIRYGLPTQDPVYGVTDKIESVLPMNTDLKYNTPQYTTITNDEVDAVSIIIQVPSLAYFDDNGTVDETDVQISVSIAPDVEGNPGTFVAVSTTRLYGKTISPYQRAIRVPIRKMIADGDLPEDGSPWWIRVTRLTPDSEENQLQNATSWLSYSEIIEQVVEYSDSAYIALTLDGEKFGSKTPSRQYRIKGIKVKIPSNYNPLTRYYTGAWDGTFQTAWTDNPAWIFYDLITRTRYGLGLPSTLAVDDICSRWDLYEISKFCDAVVADEENLGNYKFEGVDDGYGEKEPRFSCNIVINAREEAYHALHALASTFRSVPYWGASRLHVVQDSPKSVTRFVNQANVEEGKFFYEGTSLRARHTVVLVSYNDPNNLYKLTPEVVQNDVGIARYGWRPLDLTAVGCKSRGQAKRLAAWTLDTEMNQTQAVSFVAGMDFADCMPGEILRVIDPGLSEMRHGGRIADVDEDFDTFTMDDPFTFDPLKSYTFVATMPTGILETGVIVNPGKATDEVTLSAPLTARPLNGAVFGILVDDEIEGQLFQVLVNIETDKHQFAITGVTYDSSKYERIDNVQFDTIPIYNPLPTGPLTAPTNIQVEEYTYMEGQNHRFGLMASWTNSVDPRTSEYEVEYKLSTTAWMSLGKSLEHTVTIPGVRSGTYYVRVRAVGMGSLSPWLESEAITVYGTVNPMPAPANLQVQGGGTDFTGPDLIVEWDAVDDVALTDVPTDWADDTTYDVDDVVHYLTSNLFYKSLEDSNIGNLPTDTDYWMEIPYALKSSKLKDYVVKVYTSGDDLLRTEYVTDNQYVYTLAKNTQDNAGTPIRSIRLRVYSRDIYLNLSDTAATALFANPAPTMSGYSPVITDIYQGLKINWSSWVNSDTDLSRFIVYLDTVNPPVEIQEVVSKNATYVYAHSLDAGTTYYIKIVPYDEFGVGVASTIVSGEPLEIPYLNIDAELLQSIVMSDSDENTEAALAVLYDRVKDSGGVSYTI